MADRALATVMRGIHAFYGPALRKALAHPRTTLLLATLTGLFVVIGASFLLEAL